MSHFLRSEPTMLTLLALLACAEEPPCDAAELELGEITAEVNDVLWRGAGASWLPAGDGVQVVSEMNEGWRITLVGNRAENGGPVGDYLVALPLEVNLSGEDGFAIAYKEFGNSLTSRDSAVGGMMTLLELYDDGSMGVCFDFTAEGGGGGSVSFSNGALRAAEGTVSGD